MALTKIHEPNSYIPIYTDYYFEYSSNINNIINFKYKIEYQENISGWTTQDTFSRYPQPDGNITFDLRRYLSTKKPSDYFLANYSSTNGVYDDVLTNQFRIKLSEQYAYQFPWGIFTSAGTQTATGVSAIRPKYYNLYDLKLTYTYPTQSQTPIFQVGSVVEVLDNGPSNNDNSINGIYTVLEVGADYIVVNGTYDSTVTYYTGSVVWADKRQITNSATTYTSATFTSINSCNEDGGILYTSLPSTGYNLRTGSKLLIPVIQYSGLTVLTNGSINYSISQSAITNSLLVYTIPSSATTLSINVSGLTGTTDSKSFNIIDKCESRFQKVTLNFLDRKGAFIPFYFDLANTKSVDVTNSNWKGLNSVNRTVKYQIDTQMIERYQLTTDWLNEVENTLFEELFTSNYIYMFYENSSIPKKVLITDKQLQKKRTVTQKLFNYTLNVEVATENFINQ